MFNYMKKALAIVAIAVGIVVFAILPASASDNAQGIAGASSYNNGDAKAKGVATFSMDFSGSMRTEGNFKSENEGSTQGNVISEDDDVIYRPREYR